MMNKDVELRAHHYMLNQHEGIPMCANCQHFHLHYIRQGTRYMPLTEGHCVTPRLKPREAWDLCQFFTAKEASAPGPARRK